VPLLWKNLHHYTDSPSAPFSNRLRQMSEDLKFFLCGSAVGLLLAFVVVEYI
jgi:hypothetical protein